MTQATQQTNLLQFPAKPLHGTLAYDFADFPDMTLHYLTDTLIATNNRLTTILEALCAVCGESLQELSPADYDWLTNYLTPAGQRCESR